MTSDEFRVGTPVDTELENYVVAAAMGLLIMLSLLVATLLCDMCMLRDKAASLMCFIGDCHRCWNEGHEALRSMPLLQLCF